MAKKISHAGPRIRAKINSEIRALVQVALENPLVSRSSFLGPDAFETHVSPAYCAFRRKRVQRFLDANGYVVVGTAEYVELPFIDVEECPEAVAPMGTKYSCYEPATPAEVSEFDKACGPGSWPAHYRYFWKARVE